MEKILSLCVSTWYVGKWTSAEIISTRYWTTVRRGGRGGGLEATSWHRHHGLIVTSPKRWQSGLGKRGEETIVLCDSCDRVTGSRPPGLRRLPTRRRSLCQLTTCAKPAFSEDDLICPCRASLTYYVPSSNHDHRLTTGENISTHWSIQRSATRRSYNRPLYIHTLHPTKNLRFESILWACLVFLV